MGGNIKLIIFLKGISMMIFSFYVLSVYNLPSGPTGLVIHGQEYSESHIISEESSTSEQENNMRNTFGIIGIGSLIIGAFETFVAGLNLSRSWFRTP
ncbi:MAG: hypothetical protein ACLFPQ_01905 [Candidatus Woesearchaeota archaeon]